MGEGCHRCVYNCIYAPGPATPPWDGSHILPRWHCPPPPPCGVVLSPGFCFDLIPTWVHTRALSAFICALQGSRGIYRVTLWTPHRLAIRLHATDAILRKVVQKERIEFGAANISLDIWAMDVDKHRLYLKNVCYDASKFVCWL